jgi:mRNA interferase MazF
MAINFHPAIGTIVACDFNGLNTPEMTKRRPVIIISPRFRNRDSLCTIVPISTTPPSKVMPYHYKLILDPPLPKPYNNPICWVKGDMIYTLATERMHMLFIGKDENGKRIYDNRIVEACDLIKIQKCILHGLGL